MTAGTAFISKKHYTHTGLVAGQARRNGFDLNVPIRTQDGDHVKVMAVDDGHPFPIVGEVFDASAMITWLARWSIFGEYRGTKYAGLRHSLQRNAAKPGAAAPGPVMGQPIGAIKGGGTTGGKVEQARVAEKVARHVANAAQGTASLAATPLTQPVQEHEFDSAFADASAAAAAECAKDPDPRATAPDNTAVLRGKTIQILERRRSEGVLFINAPLASLSMPELARIAVAVMELEPHQTAFITVRPA